MWFQVNNKEEGYVVECFVAERDEWCPLRNFGSRQGDARIYCYEDCPKLSDLEIRQTLKLYDPRVIYTRKGFRQYKKEKQNDTQHQIQNPTQDHLS